jgi:hypothetical protein
MLFFFDSEWQRRARNTKRTINPTMKNAFDIGERIRIYGSVAYGKVVNIVRDDEHGLLYVVELQKGQFNKNRFPESQIGTLEVCPTQPMNKYWIGQQVQMVRARDHEMQAHVGFYGHVVGISLIGNLYYYDVLSMSGETLTCDSDELATFVGIGSRRIPILTGGAGNQTEIDI